MLKNKLDYWMVKKGLKNKYLADLCGVTETTFSKWRKNKTQPDLLQSAIIAKVMSISVDDLVKWEEEN